MVASQRYLELLDEVEKRIPALIQEMRELHINKGAGYSGSDNLDTFANFREAERWGSTPLKGSLIRLGDKYRRAQVLYVNPADEKVGEHRRTTLLDLAAYGLISIVLDEEEDA